MEEAQARLLAVKAVIGILGFCASGPTNTLLLRDEALRVENLWLGSTASFQSSYASILQMADIFGCKTLGTESSHAQQSIIIPLSKLR